MIMIYALLLIKLPHLILFQPSKVYEEVLIANDDNMASMEKPGGDEKKVKFKQTPPAQFYTNQPIPQNGIICYMSAFSDRGL